MKICIIGAGWYGCHLALALKKTGHDVVIYEKNHEIFSKISGTFGIRLHAGPHYPRSTETRKSCRRGFTAFQMRYPELVIPHEYAIYGLGEIDADGNPSKVNDEQFRRVCEESTNSHLVAPSLLGYRGLISAYNVEEPSIALGQRLRNKFTAYLRDAGIEVFCDFEVSKLISENSRVIVGNDHSSAEFDKVINATSYQAHVPKDDDFPFDMEVIYQPCLALIYKDKTPGARPFSFIVMDGWFPCMMPYICDGDDTASRRYILTHGKWTIMGSFHTVAEANDVLYKLDSTFIENKIKPPSESEMSRFWPEFAERFEYIGWKGEILAKLKTKREFRSAVTYEKNNIIHIVAGKVSNIFDAEYEVLSLLCKENVLERNGYLYVAGGVLDESSREIAERPGRDEPNTSNLTTFEDLQKNSSAKQAGPQTSVGFFSTLSELSRCSQTTSQAISLHSTNYYFRLKCLAGILGASALLAIAIVPLPIIRTVAPVLLSSVGVIGIGYCGARLFTRCIETPPEILGIVQPHINT